MFTVSFLRKCKIKKIVLEKISKCKKIQIKFFAVLLRFRDLWEIYWLYPGALKKKLCKVYCKYVQIYPQLNVEVLRNRRELTFLIIECGFSNLPMVVSTGIPPVLA